LNFALKIANLQKQFSKELLQEPEELPDRKYCHILVSNQLK
jgi:hypothetical protein